MPAFYNPLRPTCMHPRAALAGMLVLAMAGMWGADGAGNVPADATTPAASDATAPSAADAAALLAALPQVPELAVVGDAVVWSGDGRRATVVRIDAATGDPQIATAIGPLKIATNLLEQHRTAVLGPLAALVARAQAARLHGIDLRLEDGVLTGPHLSGTDVVVLADGVLHAVAPVGDRAGEVKQLSDAVTALRGFADATGLDAIGQRSLDNVLQRLDRPDGKANFDEIRPSFARREVRHGFLRTWYHGGPAAAAARAVETAVAATARLRPVRGYHGDGISVDDLRDAFGVGGWVMSTPTGVAYLYDEPKAEFFRTPTGIRLLVQLPAGADPTDADPATGARAAVAAKALHGDDVIAAWTSARGFTVDAEAWETALAITGDTLAPHALPPHILISGLDGDVAALAVPGGLLVPPADLPTGGAAGRADRERFLNDAAKMLGEAASLDLIGEYLFAYVYPSPDADHPELLGSKQLNSNLQQTVWQTTGNAVGGIMHGDCADIAELYQNITQRQGMDPVVIGLPEHAACAWADQPAGDHAVRDRPIAAQGAWRVQLLQTGPPLAFQAATLPECLRKTYANFAPGRPFDADAISLLLRFSDEASRSSWQLSWRIFQDPAYFQTMTEVQRDWHLGTYQRGIATMTAMIAAGDDDNANYRELAGLYARTGEYAKCADYQQQATNRTTDPESISMMEMRLVARQLDAGEMAQATAVATDLLDHRLPPRDQQPGLAVASELVGFTYCLLLNEHGPGLPAIGERVVNERLRPTLGAYTDSVADYIEQRFDPRAWDHDPTIKSIRSAVNTYIALAINLMTERRRAGTSPDELGNALGATIERWLQTIAFRDIREDSDIMNRYSDAGMWYGAKIGLAALDARLDAVAMPTAALGVAEHQNRGDGDAQMARDLPWIRASVTYWTRRMAVLFNLDHPSIDPAEIARLAKHLAEAHATMIALGMDSPATADLALINTEIAALISRDDGALRAALTAIGRGNDKFSIDSAATWIGTAARFIPPDDFAKVLAAWRDTIDHQSGYFHIAWRAASCLAPEQALMTARAAVARYPQEKDFAEELGYMEKVLAGPGPQKPAPMAEPPATPGAAASPTASGSSPANP